MGGVPWSIGSRAVQYHIVNHEKPMIRAETPKKTYRRDFQDFFSPVRLLVCFLSHLHKGGIRNGNGLEWKE